MTCKDCIHRGFCNADVWIREDGSQMQESPSTEKECVFFAEKGRVIVLPCKVGDKVYFVTVRDALKGETLNIIETEIEKVGVRKTGLFFKMDCNAVYETSASAIGKTVFFKREEAEKEIERRKNNAEIH